MIGDDDPTLQSKVIEALGKASRPTYTDIKVNWGVPAKSVIF